MILIGAGGHAGEVLDILAASGLPAPEGVLDDRPEAAARLGLPHLGGFRALEGVCAGRAVAIAVGDTRLRAALAARLEACGAQRPVLRHPSSVVSPTARVGAGAQILAFAYLGAGAEVAADAIVNVAAVVGHDASLGPAAHLAARAVLSAGARAGARTLIGNGAIVLPRIAVGADALVGAGAVVTRPLPDGVRAWGVPARAG
ncbi:MAG: NeuD/PglB/VioB family sugar acetyltransferase [Acetobacteraceae bacterium]|nr:NeuD/PglB/VioB family sugar acetyltransferase [Acetobacteraceae bacterium]